ncbi:hypothetical protein QE152_g17912 [Popillia japonica]|uniref:Uncharacterized protein n=1 Tax=Popillia japonica TaxID=7064 RepID=A0AAW1L440_POPJA
MVLFVDRNQFSCEDKMEELKNSFPALMHFTEGELKEGSMEFVKLHLEVQKGTKKDQTRYINTFYALPMTMDNSGVTDLEVIHKSTEMDIRIAEHKPESKEGNNRNDNRLEKEKIIIKAQSGKINIEEENINIKGINKTNKGNLLLEVVGGKAGLAVKQHIQQGDNNADIVIKANETTVHITDIDASIEQEERKTEIMKAERAAKNLVRIISMRSTRSGNQTATISLTNNIAKNVIQRGCHIFGHKKEECQNEDRSGQRLKCLKPDHKPRDCKVTPTCVVCRKEGHHADQIKCPDYRKLIEEGSIDISRKPIKLVNLGAPRIEFPFGGTKTLTSKGKNEKPQETPDIQWDPRGQYEMGPV